MNLRADGPSFRKASVGLLVLIYCLGLPLGKSAFAQLSSPTDVAKFVYGKLPDLALENQYVRSENNKQAVESTLISRLVQYHRSIKGRAPNYRFDWKITLADYLGINEVFQPETYPGYAFLKKNPLDNDMAVIQKLNIAQRNALVQALVDAFTGSQTAVNPVRVPVSQSKPPSVNASPSPSYQPVLTPLAKPGSADLLQTTPIGNPVIPGSGEAQYLK